MEYLEAKKQKNFDNIVPSAPSWLANFKIDSEILVYRVKPELRETISSFVATLRV
jgi:hypothetical protein